MFFFSTSLMLSLTDGFFVSWNGLLQYETFDLVTDHLKTLTLYHTIWTAFNDLENRSPLTTLWDKEKMLVTSVFSLSHKVSAKFKAHFSV